MKKETQQEQKRILSTVKRDLSDLIDMTILQAIEDSIETIIDEDVLIELDEWIEYVLYNIAIIAEKTGRAELDILLSLFQDMEIVTGYTLKEIRAEWLKTKDADVGNSYLEMIGSNMRLKAIFDFMMTKEKYYLRELPSGRNATATPTEMVENEDE